MSDEWPTTFQPHIEAILVARPELRSRFQIIYEDGYAEFIEAPTKTLPDGSFDSTYYLEQDRLWDKGTTYGDDEIGERVIDGHRWRVRTDPNLQEAIVTVDGEYAGEGPDFEHKFYPAFELVELGLWPMPDFEAIWKARVGDAELAVAHHDRMIADAAAQRNRLVSVVEEAKTKLAHYMEPKLTPLEIRARGILDIIDEFRPEAKASLEMMSVPDDLLRETIKGKLSR